MAGLLCRPPIDSVVGNWPEPLACMDPRDKSPGMTILEGKWEAAVRSPPSQSISFWLRYT